MTRLRLAPRPPKLRTVGPLAAELGIPLHKLNYLIRTRGIRPGALAGRVRLFDRAAVNRLREILEGGAQ